MRLPDKFACRVVSYSAEYIGRRKSVPEAAINNYLAPFYESLLKMEKIGGVELSSRFFKNYLTKQGKDYIDL